MPRLSAFKIVYAETAKQHLRGLTARQRAMAVHGIEASLTYGPKDEARNRKPMRENDLGAEWELRIGDLRVYYDVQEQPERLVSVLAVGLKVGNAVRIGGEEVAL